MSTQREWLRSGAQMMLLSLIQEQDRYGFEIIQELQKRSDNTFVMKEGSLYPRPGPASTDIFPRLLSRPGRAILPRQVGPPFLATASQTS